MKFVVKLSFALSLLFIFSCKKNNTTTQTPATGGSTLPSSTISVFSITAQSAVCNVTISQGGSTVPSAIGICWDTVPNPTIHSDTIVYNGVRTGSFVIQLRLKAKTTYYVRAFASNAYYTEYSSDAMFTTLDTWSLIGFNKNVNCMISSGGNLIAGTNEGIYISSNEGVQWSGPGFLAVPGTTINAFVKNSAYLFACTNGGFYKSADNGASWSRVNIGINDPNITTAAANGSVVFINTGSHGIWKSMDSGSSWAAIVQPDTNYNASCIAFNGTDLYAEILYHGLYKSSDGGNSWISFNNGLPSSLPINAIAFTGNNVIIGTGSGVFVSAGGTGNWSEIVSSPISVFSMVTEGNSVVTTGVVGAYLSTDNGNSFTLLGAVPGNTVYKVIATDSHYYFAGGYYSLYRLHR